MCCLIGQMSKLPGQYKKPEFRRKSEYRNIDAILLSFVLFCTYIIIEMRGFCEMCFVLLMFHVLIFFFVS